MPAADWETAFNAQQERAQLAGPHLEYYTRIYQLN